MSVEELRLRAGACPTGQGATEHVEPKKPPEQRQEKAPFARLVQLALSAQGEVEQGSTEPGMRSDVMV